MLKQIFLSLTVLCSMTFPVAAHANIPLAVELDLLEMHFGKGYDHFVFDSTVTVGDGPDYLIALLSGGSDIGPRVDELELQALYGRDVGGGATVLAGIRHDARAGADLTHGSFAVQGSLAPWLDAETFFFLSENGNVTGTAQLVGSWNLAEALVFEPRLAVGWSAQDIGAEDTGNGLTDAEISARLRRQILPNLDLYLGVTHERLIGGTRDIAVTAGERGDNTLFVMGGGWSF